MTSVSSVNIIPNLLTLVNVSLEFAAEYSKQVILIKSSQTVKQIIGSPDLTHLEGLPLY